jgi:hypothetical protein
MTETVPPAEYTLLLMHVIGTIMSMDVAPRRPCSRVQAIRGLEDCWNFSYWVQPTVWPILVGVLDGIRISFSRGVTSVLSEEQTQPLRIP